MATGYTGGDPSKLDKAGGTMTGPLVLEDGSPAASEDYVATHGGGGGGVGLSATVVDETAFGQAPAAGTATTAAHGDHTHGTPPAPTAASVGADPAGTASSAVTAHVAASDPHGDRAYADGKLATKADLVGGVIPTAQLPALAINDVFTVASQAAMLALTAQRGDIAIRSDIHETYVLAADDPTVLANWVKLDHPADAVNSVNGQTGTVVLAASDVGAVPTARQINTDATLTGGGDLSTDRTLGVTPNSTTQRIEVAKAGTLVGTRKRVNLIEGSNVTLTVADNTGADRVDVTVSAAGGGSGFGQSRDAAMLGLQAVTMPFYAAVQGSNGEVLPSGTVVWQLWRPGAVTITNLGTWLTAAGVTGSGVNAMALADAAGNLIDQTADMTALFSGPLGYIEAALSGGPHALSDVNYYVGILAHFSGSAPRTAGSTLTGNPPAFKTTPPCVVVTGQSAFASFNPNTATKNNGSYFMAAS